MSGLKHANRFAWCSVRRWQRGQPARAAPRWTVASRSIDRSEWHCRRKVLCLPYRSEANRECAVVVEGSFGQSKNCVAAPSPCASSGWLLRIRNRRRVLEAIQAGRYGVARPLVRRSTRRCVNSTASTRACRCYELADPSPRRTLCPHRFTASTSSLDLVHGNRQPAVHREAVSDVNQY